MILPTTYELTLLLSVLSMICWGSWANTLKLAGPKWRFELFYFDYAFGVLLTGVIAAFTFGSLGVELSFRDNLLIAGKRQMAYAFAAGAVFNLANMLLVGAISIAGMAVAFPIGIGLALVIGTIGNYVQQRTGNPIYIFGGVALVAVAILLAALAYGAMAKARPVEEEAGARPGNVKRKKSPGAAKGIIISIISGVLMGSFYPLVVMSQRPEAIGLGPYSIAFFFAIGVFLTTIVYNLYFINLPIHGEATELGAYLKGSAGQHLLGILGGITWCVGAVANFVAGAAGGEARVGPAVSYALGQGATMISVLWGLLVWREFAGAGSRATLFIVLMFVFFAAGLGLISIAPIMQ
jgi:glucose uptake protein